MSARPESEDLNQPDAELTPQVSAVPSVNETLPVSASLPEPTSVEGGVEPQGAEDTPLPESAKEGLITVTEHPILLPQIPVEESAYNSDSIN